MDVFLLTLDLIGTFVFAVSGATVAVRHRLDLFGVLVLSFAAATSGGIARDVLIGAVPPAAFLDSRYILISVAAGLITFYRFTLIERLNNPMLVFDAAGLSVFAVTGALKALSFDLSPLTAILLGMLSGIGGGLVRDMLVAQIPVVLRSELYAVAAMLGAAVVVAGEMLALPPIAVISAGILLCFGLRLFAIRYGWRLPTPRERH